MIARDVKINKVHDCSQHDPINQISERAVKVGLWPRPGGHERQLPGRETSETKPGSSDRFRQPRTAVGGRPLPTVNVGCPVAQLWRQLSGGEYARPTGAGRPVCGIREAKFVAVKLSFSGENNARWRPKANTA